MDFADIAAQAADRHLSESMETWRRKKDQPAKAYTHCEDCGEQIPEARRLAMPGCTRCAKCQSEADRWNG